MGVRHPVILTQVILILNLRMDRVTESEFHLLDATGVRGGACLCTCVDGCRYGPYRFVLECILFELLMFEVVGFRDDTDIIVVRILGQFERHMVTTNIISIIVRIPRVGNTKRIGRLDLSIGTYLFWGKTGVGSLSRNLIYTIKHAGLNSKIVMLFH